MNCVIIALEFYMIWRDTMILGIDIDDVVTESSLSMVAHAKIHETEICQKGDILDHLPDVMRGEFPTPEVKIYLNKFMADIMDAAVVKENAVEVLCRLKEKGHKLIYITARGENKFPGSTEVTENLLKDKNLPCDGMVYNSYDKLQDCIDNGVELMIDDSVKNCTDIAKGGIPTLLFTSIVNEDAETDLPRVATWLELEQYVDTMAK